MKKARAVASKKHTTIVDCYNGILAAKNEDLVLLQAQFAKVRMPLSMKIGNETAFDESRNGSDHCNWEEDSDHSFHYPHKGSSPRVDLHEQVPQPRLIGSGHDDELGQILEEREREEKDRVQLRKQLVGRIRRAELECAKMYDRIGGRLGQAPLDRGTMAELTAKEEEVTSLKEQLREAQKPSPMRICDVTALDTQGQGPLPLSVERKQRPEMEEDPFVKIFDSIGMGEYFNTLGFHGITDELDLMQITSPDHLPSDIPEFARQKLVAHARSLAILGKGGRKAVLMQKRGIVPMASEAKVVDSQEQGPQLMLVEKARNQRTVHDDYTTRLRDQKRQREQLMQQISGTQKKLNLYDEHTSTGKLVRLGGLSMDRKSVGVRVTALRDQLSSLKAQLADVERPLPMCINDEMALGDSSVVSSRSCSVHAAESSEEVLDDQEQNVAEQPQGPQSSPVDAEQRKMEERRRDLIDEIRTTERERAILSACSIVSKQRT